MPGLIFDLILYLLFKKHDTSGEHRGDTVFIPFEDCGIDEQPQTDYFPDDFNNVDVNDNGF